MKPIIRIISTMALFCICLPHFSFSQSGSISVLTPVCNHNGILVATITGGTPGNLYSYNWYTNDGYVASSAHYDLTDTLYNFSGGPVMVHFEENGAFLDLVFDTISYAFDLQFTVVPDSCPLQTGAITTTINGAFPPVTYNWTYGGIPYGGNTPSITNLTGGIYDCVITDGAGCQMNLTDMLTDSALSNYQGVVVPSVTNLSLSVSTTPSNCNNGTATVVATGGAQPYNYLWSNGQTTSTATGMFAPSFINVTVTDNNGCVAYSGAYFTSTVFISPNFSTTPSNCAFNNGAISVNPTGGTAPYTFLWNTMAVSQNINNLPVGVYSVIITDAAGCVNTSYANVFAISPVNVTQSFTPSICTGATGTATLNATGGTAPYSYLWYTTPVQVTQTATGLAPGIYNFSVTDSQGCIKTGSVNVPQNTNLTMFVNSTPSVCALNNGSASTNVMGGTIPYSYLWSNGQTTDSISGLTPGNYFCTVTDASGCSVSDCINVNSTSQLYCILNPQPATCLYTADGAISINIITGTAPYTYQWSNGMTSSSVSGLLPGNYHVTVTDANGCTFSQSVNVSFTSVNPCTSIIQGKVYIDLNNNCIMDPGEPTMENIPVRCNTTNEIAFTDVNGNYQFYHPSGIAEIEQLPVPSDISRVLLLIRLW